MPSAVVAVSEQQMKNLAALDLWLAKGPSYTKSALWGAALAAGLTYLKFRKQGLKGKAQKRLLKHSVYGAGAGAASLFALFQLGKWASTQEHKMLAPAAVHVAPPATPVVTKGHFAGAARALYPTVDSKMYR